MADRNVHLHCRMRPDELELLDELAVHFEQDNRASMVRAMMKDFRSRMKKENAKQQKESAK